MKATNIAPPPAELATYLPDWMMLAECKKYPDTFLLKGGAGDG